MLLVLLVAVAVAEAAPSGLLQNRTLLGGKRFPGPLVSDLPCPSPGDIHPCSCLHTRADFARIWCNGIRPTTDIKGIFNHVSGFQVRYQFPPIPETASVVEIDVSDSG